MKDKINIKLSLFLKCLLVGCIGIIGGLSLVMAEYFADYDLQLIVSTIIKEKAYVGFLSLIVGPCLLLCCLGIIAYLVGRKTDKVLEEYRKQPNKKDIKFWIILFVSAIVLPIGYFFLQTYVVNKGFYAFNGYILTKSIFYDSIIGELFFNFCVTSLIVFLVSKVFFKKTGKINKIGLILSVLFSVLFLFSIQLNSLFSIYTVITALFLLWAVLQYFVMDLIYAYLYVRYGLKWSLFVHIIFTIMLLGVCPLLFV